MCIYIYVYTYIYKAIFLSQMLIHTYYIHIYLYMYSCDVKGKTYAGTEQVTPRRTAQPFYGRGRRYGVTMGIGMGNLMISLW